MKNWFKGLGNALLNGGIASAGGAVYQWAQSGGTSPISWKPVGMLFVSGAVMGVINYFIKSPRQEEVK
jgi:1,4-dihydroxy-2-naphthoate octaprenyltransferase